MEPIGAKVAKGRARRSSSPCTQMNLTEFPIVAAFNASKASCEISPCGLRTVREHVLSKSTSLLRIVLRSMTIRSVVSPELCMLAATTSPTAITLLGFVLRMISLNIGMVFSGEPSTSCPNGCFSRGRTSSLTLKRALGSSDPECVAPRVLDPHVLCYLRLFRVDDD